MTGKEVFRIWAPAGRKWVDWVRPVSFIGINTYSKKYIFSNFTVPTISFLDEKQEDYSDAAIIVDLPGMESVKEGIALAREGFRPIPVYNGTIEQSEARATVDNHAVGVALLWGAAELCKIELRADARPAFLLDSNRMHRFKMENSLFDNSWDVYPQDLPSAEYLVNNGVRRIIVIGDSLSKDLEKILYEFQKKHIKILLTDGYEVPKKLRVHKSFYKN